MKVISIVVFLFSASCSVLSKPYEYSYYLSLPGHYQSLAVRDGEVTVNDIPTSANVGPVNPNFRQGRIGPGFSRNPEFGRRFPINPIGPDFSRGVDDIPDGELDPLFNQGGRYPQGEGRAFPGTQNNGPNIRGPDSRFNQIGPITPNQNSYNYYNRIYNEPASNTPEFGARLQPRGISRRSEEYREIDETRDLEKEEVTTEATTEPCSFCGVDKVNSMDGIDDNKNVNPDSESVDPAIVGKNNNPKILIANNVVTPANVVFPGYSPLVPYYVVL